jgi:hypothetical protein
MLNKTLMSIVLASTLGSGLAQAVTLEDVESSFYPYKDGGPSFPGLDVGMTINSGNVAQFEDVLDEAVFEQIKNGWFEMKVGETTSFDLHPNYVEATRKSVGQVSLGEELGQIDGFVAGRPFPEEPSADDPRRW